MFGLRRRQILSRAAELPDFLEAFGHIGHRVCTNTELNELIRSVSRPSRAASQSAIKTIGISLLSQASTLIPNFSLLTLSLRHSVASLTSPRDGSRLTVAIGKAGTTGAELLMAERIAQISAFGAHRSTAAKALGPKHQGFTGYMIGS